MRIVVCTKQVPDTEAQLKVAPDGRSLEESDVTFVMNPYDEFAVEEAIQLRERGEAGTTVTLLTVGPERTEEVLRRGLAMGADSAVRVFDESLAEADSGATAEALSAAVQRLGFDLILCGRVAIDDAAAQVGLRLAEKLGIPHANAVTQLGLDEGTLIAKCEIEGGAEVLQMPLPALVTAQKGLNAPRYPAIPAVMKARRVEITLLSSQDLGLDPEAAAGRQSRILELEPPPVRPPGRLIDGDPAEAARTLAHLLRDEAKVI
ncbi:MAG: electron transfer flavoprotein subunit beta/FixA family protein [Thermoleophilia bacterium]